MKKLINAPETVLAESLDGFAEAHADIVQLGEERKFVRRRLLKPGKPALISGGGSGHEPLHAGFVGFGMLDAACPGQVFTSPTPDQMIAAVAEVDTGGGALFIVKNYEGDVMNFEMAAELAGSEVLTVITDDDVAGTFTFVLHKKTGTEPRIGLPRAETPNAYMTMGFSADLDEAMRIAVREMLDLITERLGITRSEAYRLASLAADFHVTQTVNGQNGIHGLLPKSVIG